MCTVVTVKQSCCSIVDEKVSLCSCNKMSQEVENGSRVEFSTVENTEARAATAEAPAGVVEPAAKPSDSPSVVPMDTDEVRIAGTGRGPRAQCFDESVGATAAWVAPIHTQRPVCQQPKREFTPHLCELCFEECISGTRSAYNNHLKRAHGDMGVFFSGKRQCLVSRKGTKGQPQFQGVQMDRGVVQPWPSPVPLGHGMARPMAPVAPCRRCRKRRPG